PPARRPCAPTPPGAGRGPAWSGCAGRTAARWPTGSRAAGRRCQGSGSGAGAGSRLLAFRLAEAITQAAHRLDDVVAEFAPQVVDVHVERVALHLVAQAVERVLQLIAAEDAPPIAQQRFQQGVLAPGQLHRLTVQQGLAGAGVVTQRAV